LRQGGAPPRAYETALNAVTPVISSR